MKKLICDACGRPLSKRVNIKSAVVCPDCGPEVLKAIARAEAAGLPVNGKHIAHGIFKNKYATGDYFLRDPPAALMTAAKHRAADAGCSVREIILAALAAYIKK